MGVGAYGLGAGSAFSGKDVIRRKFNLSGVQRVSLEDPSN